MKFRVILVTFVGTKAGESYPSAEVQLVYSTAPAVKVYLFKMIVSFISMHHHHQDVLIVRSPLFLAGPLDCIQCPHRAKLCCVPVLETIEHRL